MDRTPFRSFGADLSDAEFACALAALLIAHDPFDAQPALDPANILSRLWQRHRAGPVDFRVAPTLAWARGGWDHLSAHQALKIWREVRERLHRTFSFCLYGAAWPYAPKSYLRGSEFDNATRDVLSNAAVGAASVVLMNTPPNDGRSDWRLPITFSWPPSEAIVMPERRDENYPAQFGLATRDAPQSNILVFARTAPQALTALLTAPRPYRACLVLIAGSAGGMSPLQLRVAVDSICAQTNAEGVAILGASLAPAELSAQLAYLGDALAHNERLDEALFNVFGRSVRLFFSERMLDVGIVDAQVDAILPKLRNMPDAVFRLTRGARETLLRTPQREGVSDIGALEISAKIDEARADYGFLRESHEAAALTELTARIREAETTAPSEARFIQRKQEDSRDGGAGLQRKGFVVGESALEVFRIAPPEQGWESARTEFPDEELPADGRARRLQVVFSEPSKLGQPLTTEIVLPPRGASTEARFEFTPHASGPFEARIAVLYRGRILQTALICATVYPDQNARERSDSELSFCIESEQRRNLADLAERRVFDLSFIANSGSDRRHSALAISKKHTLAKSLKGIDKPVTEINKILTRVADEPEKYDSVLTRGAPLALIRDLALVGRDLYDVLFTDEFEPLAKGGYLQDEEAVGAIQIITARDDAVLPIEFIYDRDAPDDDARMCPKHTTALKDGACPVNCAGQKDQEKYVCPMGFWGLRKIIERHRVDRRIDLPQGAEVVLQSEPHSGRNVIPLRAGAVLGHSNRVVAADAEALVRELSKQTAKKSKKVAEWDEWRSSVGVLKPSVLVAYPHNLGKYPKIELEMGGLPLKTVGIKRAYVAPADEPPTLVLLLGCDTAGTAADFSTPISRFRRAGASVVVGTIATVFGEHAPAVGELLMKTAYERAAANPVRLGEVIRDTRREALLKKLPMALCVAAYGDADWLLGV